MRYSNNKDINHLIRKLLRSGWRYRQGRHGKLIHPSGSAFITVSKTPSDWRGFKNIKRDIRRLSSEVSNPSVVDIMDGK